jgi:site-specific recombinase XerD
VGKMEINQNMLRERAVKLPDITNNMWNKINQENKDLFDEYFESNAQLSLSTKKQYISGMKQFFWYINVRCKNKPMYEITKRDFIKYISFLTEHGLASKSIGFKKSSVSTLCNFIENIIMYDDTSGKYDNFRNFTRGMPKIPENQVYDKSLISEEEYNLMMSVLEEKENYLYMAWLATAYHVGARKAGIIQFKTEILDYDMVVDKNGNTQNYILSNVVREKGFGLDGSQKRYMINRDALKYMKLWVENRGFDNEYIFSHKIDGKIKLVSKQWANYLCHDILSPIICRRVTPHAFKANLISQKLIEGHDLKVVSKYIALHKDIAVTTKFYDLRSDDEEMNKLF